MPATSLGRGSTGSIRALFRSSLSAEVAEHVVVSSGVGNGSFGGVGEGGFGGAGCLAGTAGLGGVGGFSFSGMEVAFGFFGEGCLTLAGDVLVDRSVYIGEASRTVVSFIKVDSVELSCLLSSQACGHGPCLIGDFLGDF